MMLQVSRFMAMHTLSYFPVIRDNSPAQHFLREASDFGVCLD